MGTGPERTRPRILWIRDSRRGRGASRQRKSQRASEGREPAAACANEGEQAVKVLNEKLVGKGWSEGVRIETMGFGSTLETSLHVWLLYSWQELFESGVLDDLCKDSLLLYPRHTLRETLERITAMIAESCTALVQKPIYTHVQLLNPSPNSNVTPSCPKQRPAWHNYLSHRANFLQHVIPPSARARARVCVLASLIGRSPSGILLYARFAKNNCWHRGGPSGLPCNARVAEFPERKDVFCLLWFVSRGFHDCRVLR